MENKTINKIKLTINTSCNLDCNYCFVKKTHEKMGLTAARNSIDLLLSSKGSDKLLSIYGGEPFLDTRLLKEMLSYARIKQKEVNKKLVITVCTNFTLVNQEILRLLSKYNVRLIISLAGSKKYHDRERKYFRGPGTYLKIKKNLPMALDILGDSKIGVSFCVFPSTVKQLFSNFNHLINLGFKYFNLEIIREYEDWTPEKINMFTAGFMEITQFLFDQITENLFLFLNPINWEIKYRFLTYENYITCPFNYKLEVYPKGEMAFSPFLLNAPNRQKYIIGDVGSLNKSKFINCSFNPDSHECSNCENSYFDSYRADVQASKVYRIYHFLCLKASQEIMHRAQTDRRFAKYIQIIKKEICF